jgi:hypothetical protein
MTVFTTKSDGVVWIKAIAEGPGILGDMTIVLKPGESFLAHSYEWWAALEDGEHSVV